MKRKGISLIVLIITIVVIIILGTAIIVSIAKTNIINNANEAVLKSDVANLKSELEMYVTDQFVATKGKYDREKLNADVGQAKYNEENVEDKNKDGKTNIYDVLNSLKNSNLDGAIYIQEGNIVFIRSKFNSSQLKVLAKMGEEIDGTPKITDIVSKSDFTSITVSADVTSPEEVEKYIYILNDGEGVETTESSKTFEGLEPATKYTVTIKALLKDGTEIEMVKEISTLDNTPPIEPVINSSYGYPLLTLDGIVDGGETTIVFDTSEGVKNEYSLDGGETWNEYKGVFYVNEACTIMAKSLKPNGLESSSSIEVTVPTDALGPEAYNENDTDYVQISGSNLDDGMNVGVIYIDSEMIGENILITYTAYNESDGKSIFSFYDSNNNFLESKEESSNSDTVIYKVPKNAAVLKITKKLRYYTRIYNIGVANEPVINNTKFYPTITSKGVNSSYDEITINYFKTSVQRLYKINDGEWLEYENKPIKLGLNETIYAKGIDKNNNETRIVSEFKSTLPEDAMGPEAYDSADDTYQSVSSTSLYLLIDESSWENYILIHHNSYGDKGTGLYIKFYAQNGKLLNTENSLHTGTNYTTITVEKKILVPNNSYKMEIYKTSRNNNIYEISLLNQPFITQVDKTQIKYPTLTSKGVVILDNKLRIKYNYASVKKLYKIDDGEWKNYTGEYINVENYKTVYAKGIDSNGIESITASYVANIDSGYIGGAAFDGDQSSFYLAGNTATRYINVDSNAWGKKIRILSKGYQSIRFYNESDVVLHSKVGFRSTDNTYTIPEGTTYIEYYFNESGGVYEIILVE